MVPTGRNQPLMTREGSGVPALHISTNYGAVGGGSYTMIFSSDSHFNLNVRMLHASVQTSIYYVTVLTRQCGVICCLSRAKFLWIRAHSRGGPCCSLTATCFHSPLPCPDCSLEPQGSGCPHIPREDSHCLNCYSTSHQD